MCYFYVNQVVSSILVRRLLVFLSCSFGTCWYWSNCDSCLLMSLPLHSQSNSCFHPSSWDDSCFALLLHALYECHTPWSAIHTDHFGLISCESSESLTTFLWGVRSSQMFSIRYEWSLPWLGSLWHSQLSSSWCWCSVASSHWLWWVLSLHQTCSTSCLILEFNQFVELVWSQCQSSFLSSCYCWGSSDGALATSLAQTCCCSWSWKSQECWIESCQLCYF